MGLSPSLADCPAAMLQMCPIVKVRVERPYPPINLGSSSAAASTLS